MSKYNDPKLILDQMGRWLTEGDADSITDLIGLYIHYSGRHTMESFAKRAYVTTEDITDMVSHREHTPMYVLLQCINVIYEDSQPK